MNVFSASLDGEGSLIRYEPVSLSRFYLEASRDFSRAAIESESAFNPLRDIVCGITFSAMCIESFVGELAEEVISPKKMKAFDRGWKPYVPPNGTSPVAFKYAHLVSMRGIGGVPKELMSAIKKVFEYRNRLVHYKVSENRGWHELAPPSQERRPGGGLVYEFLLSGVPHKSELPFVHQLSDATAAFCYNTARDVVRLWVINGGNEWDEVEFCELSARN